MRQRLGHQRSQLTITRASGGVDHASHAPAQPEAITASARPMPGADATTHANPAYPLYDPAFEHDACGIGFVAHVSGRRDHHIVEYGLEALLNLAHRGAMDAEAETSDGVGVLTHLPHHLIGDWLAEHGYPEIAPAKLALGMFFFPSGAQDHAGDVIGADEAHSIAQAALERVGMRLVAWRVVPTDSRQVGRAARASMPCIEQAIVACPARLTVVECERRLFLARKQMERAFAERQFAAYVASLSSQTVVYKGLLTAAQLPAFYTDLRDPRYETGVALFHQRYSTNTFPQWRLAQPMRLLAHNGEINTVQGNRNWMAMREGALGALWDDDAATLAPTMEPGGSDSTSLDNALDLATHSGGDLLHMLRILAPAAWEHDDGLRPEARAFYQTHAPQMEPWDGPAALVFSDGRVVGAALDRNGLRPLRYVRSADDLLLVASEVGPLPLDNARIVEKGRLGPGGMLALDLERGAILYDAAITDYLSARRPYRAWAARHIFPVEPAPSAHARHLAGASPDAHELLTQQTLFGYSHEDVELILRPMVADGQEAVWSMGDDTPLAVLSRQSRPLASYFKQRFAQVTNPPIDPLREKLVMSLTTYLGPRDLPFADAEPGGRVLRLPSPLLDEATLDATLALAHRQRLKPTRLTTGYRPSRAVDATTGAVGAPADDDGADLRAALDALETQAVAAVEAGAGLLVLSDRGLRAGAVPLPAPLAVAATHHALARARLRLRVGLIVETGAAWDAHQIALLIGYGANAVCPHLALATARSLAGGRGLTETTPDAAADHYIGAIEKGLLKILARMGLSVIESYLGAQLFECVGIASEMVDRYFRGTPTSLGGLTLADLARQLRAQGEAAQRVAQAHATPAGQAAGARAEQPRLADRGDLRFRRNGEYHAANPQVVRALQQAALSGDPADYARYTDLVYSRPPTAIRDLLALRTRQPVPLDEVESADAIVRRFVSTAMSLGSLSPEAHQTLTLGANRLGARSNTGEGGEDPAWMTGERDGVSTNSRIKQIASGRFGVTAAYLAHADEIEIKMAQGSKPGEGGQLPARKVTPLIARLRHTVVGIPLISPPPHHDIYSIEDLAQLIFDLKQVNPRAAVGVKLVAARGVGAVAAGVAKAHADYILISGHDGGTGASPLSSIKHVGLPWELGLAEAQQTLRLNGLRGRVRLRTDGGLKTGRDVVIAALLGADEFGFGSAALIAIGCDMARQCHLDTCPAGIATQREDLRRKFTGRPEQVVAFLRFVAEEARTLLASLGARSFDEIIGRADLLATLAPTTDETDDLNHADTAAIRHQRPDTLDLAPLLSSGEDDAPRRHSPRPVTVATLVERETDADAPASASATTPEAKLLDDAAPLLMRGYGVTLRGQIHNRDRAMGARLAGEIARRYGDDGLPSGSVTYQFSGSAGQSFGAFCVPGLRLSVWGDANDYVGKGMTGGEIILAPPTQSAFVAHEQVILGNTALYGATGGLLLARGQAGERFAVRNSGAVAVVEGAGAHGCEYMTGGVVVALGAVGANFGAGMSGGAAYVYDEDERFPQRINGETVRIARVTDADEADDLAALLRYHGEATGSDRARSLLAMWPVSARRFWRVIPLVGEPAARPLEATLARLDLGGALGVERAG